MVVSRGSRAIDRYRSARKCSGTSMNRDMAIAHFKALGAGCGVRRHSGREVIGLQLRHSAVTNGDLEFLEHLCDDVDVVGLEGTKISDAGLAHLLKLRFLDNVDLTDTAITDRGLATLSRMSSLKYIHIEGTRVSLAGVRRLQAALPECEVVCDFDVE